MRSRQGRRTVVSGVVVHARRLEDGLAAQDEHAAAAGLGMRAAGVVHWMDLRVCTRGCGARANSGGKGSGKFEKRALTEVALLS